MQDAVKRNKSSPMKKTFTFLVFILSSFSLTSISKAQNHQFELGPMVKAFQDLPDNAWGFRPVTKKG